MSVTTNTTTANTNTVRRTVKPRGLRKLAKALTKGLQDSAELEADGITLAFAAPTAVRGTLNALDEMGGSLVTGEIDVKVSDVKSEDVMRYASNTGKFLHDGIATTYKVLTEEELEEELNQIEL